jgi:hypothetical protein
MECFVGSWLGRGSMELRQGGYWSLKFSRAGLVTSGRGRDERRVSQPRLSRKRQSSRF